MGRAGSGILGARPFGGDPGYNHLPRWSKGIGDVTGRNSGNFYYVGGTSMATPHVASLAALLLQKDPSLTQADIEWILKNTALPLADNDSRLVFDFDHFATIPWDTDCGGNPCDPVGAGLIQVDAAISFLP
ncbi:MAG: S8 family serine peptidase [Chloroflexi bacterium]|nr:S8 family serine peptidase [Chloroflexota bacterium]